MLKIKDSVDLKELENFGFRLSADKIEYLKIEPMEEYCE